jgi:hypothetical protein
MLSEAGETCHRISRRGRGGRQLMKHRIGLLCDLALRYSGPMKLSQTIRFCTSADGTRIAVASCGQGQVILRAAHWLSHVDYDLESPVWRPWLSAMSARNRFVRYDPRGCGLSDRHVSDLSLDAWHADLDAVAASIEDPRFVLLGLSQGRRTRYRVCAEVSRAGLASGSPKRVWPGRQDESSDRGRAAGSRNTCQFRSYWLGTRQSGILSIFHQPLYPRRHA